MRNRGPFGGMTGNWSGGGTVTLDDGSTERTRGNRQSVVIKAENGFRGASINLSRY